MHQPRPARASDQVVCSPSYDASMMGRNSCSGNDSTRAHRAAPQDIFLRVPLAARLVDITTCAVDAIVNAANESLSRGGGVCGAIHRAAGPQLALACGALAPCPTGEARITPGFSLPARFVIHAVGPVWRGGTAREPELLAAAYRAALDIAEERALHALAFPATSTGIYGYPVQPAAAIAVGTVTDFLATSASVRDVLFACFDRDTLEAYRALGVPG